MYLVFSVYFLSRKFKDSASNYVLKVSFEISLDLLFTNHPTVSRSITAMLTLSLSRAIA
jgi:hypothetical protein